VVNLQPDSNHQTPFFMKQWVFGFLLLVLCSVSGFSQVSTGNIIDTVETDQGPVLLYRNFTWEFLGDEPIMMSSEEDSTGIFSTGWNTQQVFASVRTTPDSIHDTLLVLKSGDKSFIMPVTGKFLRGFMYSHKGLDIRMNTGDTVRAAFDGVVRYAKYNRGGFGNLIILRHFNGLETYYAHLSKIKVKVNQVVKAGDLVGLVGSTGRSRGPHLHFEVRYHDLPLDPMRMIDYEKGTLISNNFPITKQVFYPNDYNVNAVYHKIRSGDTLGLLSRKYHTSVKELCAMNKIKTSTTLRVGRTLRVR
jgi:LysM repeat protein